MANILSFLGRFTIKLFREKDIAFRMYCIRYTHGTGMGKHVDYFGIKLDKNIGYRIHL